MFIAGHFARDSPTGGGGDSGLCRNCGKEGHRAKECKKLLFLFRVVSTLMRLGTEPRDPSTMTCRNCDETGKKFPSASMIGS